MLENQGTMTQMEKGFNKGQIKNFKNDDVNAGGMVPGIFNESPLRK